MFEVAWQMLAHKPVRSLATATGLGVLFFLSAAQVGLMVGWCRTCSALVRNAGVDLWVMAEQTPSFDYGTAIPRQRVYQVRAVPGIAWAETLDWEHGSAAVRLLTDHAKQQGAMLLTVTHDPRLLPLFEHHLRIDQGRLCEVAT